MRDPAVDSLAQQIDHTRITYPENEGGVGIDGAPFTIRFDEEVDPEALYDEISTAESPWELFALKTPIGGADERYFSFALVLYHVSDGAPEGATKLDMEAAPEMVRIYPKGEEADERRIAEFTRTLLTAHPGDVLFVED